MKSFQLKKSGNPIFFYDSFQGLAIWLAPSGKLNYINPHACRLLNIDQAWATGQHISRVLKLTARDGADPYHWMLAISPNHVGSPYLESFVLTPDKQVKMITWTKAPQFDSIGQAIRIVLIGYETCETHRAETLSDNLANQMILSKISTLLMQATSDNYHHLFSQVLQYVGNFSQADRCCVMQRIVGRRYALLSQWRYECPAISVAVEDNRPIDLPEDIDRLLSSHAPAYFYPKQSDRLLQDNAPCFHHPDAASVLIAPIVVNGRVIACIAMESDAIKKDWHDDDANLLRRCAECLASTLARIRAEQDKQKSEEKYRRLIDKSPLGIFTVNRTGLLTHFNPHMKKIILLLGFDPTRPINVLTHDDLIKIGLSKDIAACLRGKPIQPITRAYDTPAGRTHYFRTHLTALRNADHQIRGVQIIVEENTALVQAEQKLQENEKFLADVLNSLKAGVVIIDPETCRIVDANPYAADLIGLNPGRIVGKVCHHFICPQTEGNCPIVDLNQEIDNSERLLLTHDGQNVPILKSVSRIQRKGRDLLLECFTDIRQLKRLMDEQHLDIQTSKNILSIINGPFPRYTNLQDELTLFSTVYYRPCQAEGGDHFFLRTLNSDGNDDLKKTIVSLKDQSGHQVGCILRSIITDLLHQAILCDNGLTEDLGKAMTRLNEQLSQGEFIDPDSFCTAAVICLDHRSLCLQYALCGHSRFLLIRDGQATEIPAPSDRHGMNVPLGFGAGIGLAHSNMLLKKKDKLIIFTDGLTDIGIGKTNHESAAASLTPLELLSAAQTEKQMALTDPVARIVEKMVAVAADACGGCMQEKSPNSLPDDITVIGLEIEDVSTCQNETWYVEDIDDLQRKIDHFIASRRQEWHDHQFTEFMRLQLCFEEAIINAWKHGNAGDPRKAISIQYRWGNDFHIRIADEGPGFDPSSVPDPREPHLLTRKCGRGIFMIRHAACGMRHNAKGNAIHLCFSSEAGASGSSEWQTKPNKMPNIWEWVRHGRSR